MTHAKMIARRDILHGRHYRAPGDEFECTSADAEYFDKTGMATYATREMVATPAVEVARRRGRPPGSGRKASTAASSTASASEEPGDFGLSASAGDPSLILSSTSTASDTSSTPTPDAPDTAASTASDASAADSSAASDSGASSD